eukprot:7616155-Prorocentrum_lima.AAC.1
MAVVAWSFRSNSSIYMRKLFDLVSSGQFEPLKRTTLSRVVGGTGSHDPGRDSNLRRRPGAMGVDA